MILGAGHQVVPIWDGEPVAQVIFLVSWWQGADCTDSLRWTFSILGFIHRLAFSRGSSSLILETSFPSCLLGLMSFF